MSAPIFVQGDVHDPAAAVHGAGYFAVRRVAMVAGLIPAASPRVQAQTRDPYVHVRYDARAV